MSERTTWRKLITAELDKQGEEGNEAHLMSEHIVTDTYIAWLAGRKDGERTGLRIAAAMVRRHMDTRPAGEVPRLSKLADAIERSDHEEA